MFTISFYTLFILKIKGPKMSVNQTTLKTIEKFSILNTLPKGCACTVCNAVRENVKAEVGTEEFQKICKVLQLK